MNAVPAAISSPDYSNKSAKKNPITSRSSSGHNRIQSLVDFQQQVAGVLGRAVVLHEEISETNEEARTSPVASIPRKVAQVLTALAIDLEHTDSPPTSSQRKLLDYETRRFEQAENQWKGLRSEPR